MTNTNATIKNLLEDNARALQFLHTANGFDFEKPFLIIQAPGKFTANTVKKAIAENITGEYIAAVLIKNADDGWRRSQLYFADFDGDKFDGARRRGLDYWNYNIDYFFSVGDFETTRKKRTEYIYIIAQAAQHAGAPGAPLVDYSGRFILTETRESGDGRGNTYISAFTVKETNGNKRKINIDLYGRVIYAAQKKSDNINDFIDKSGYLLKARRDDLQRRAAALKAERDRAAVLVADYSEKEKEINAKIATMRGNIAKRAGEILTESDAKNVEKMVYNLSRALWYYNYYQEKSAGNMYASTAQKDRTIKTIFEYLEA